MAVKLLHREKQADAECMGRFRQEVLIMARLRHPQVARFVGAVWEPPRVAVVMQLFKHGAVAAALARDVALSWQDPLLSWAFDVARGMGYLHGAGVIHRDLKVSRSNIDVALPPRCIWQVEPLLAVHQLTLLVPACPPSCLPTTTRARTA